MNKIICFTQSTQSSKHAKGPQFAVLAKVLMIDIVVYDSSGPEKFMTGNKIINKPISIFRDDKDFYILYRRNECLKYADGIVSMFEYY